MTIRAHIDVVIVGPEFRKVKVPSLDGNEWNPADHTGRLLCFDGGALHFAVTLVISEFNCRSWNS